MYLMIFTKPSFLRLMYKRHVYVDETKLTPELILSSALFLKIDKFIINFSAGIKKKKV